MRKLPSFLFAILALFHTGVAQKPDTRLAGLDTTINRLLKEWHAAGCAIAVVEKNKVLLAKGFGFENFEKRIPVTDNTLFAIGSCSKAFTASLLGMLVKDGRLDIDKPIHNYLPELQFFNEQLTNHVTARDMMCHRTGLSRHDYTWYGASVSRDSLIYRVRFLEPSAELRQAWQYNNLMFVAQGVLAEKLYGKKWEDIVKEKIFVPLGMSNSDFSVVDMQKASDYSLGYREHKDSVVRMDFMNIDPVGPAGSINSTAKDMANWVMTWINGGKFNDKEVIPASYVTQAMSSQMVVGPGLPSKEVPDEFITNYGLGWFITSYRNHYLVHHGGNIDGFSASTSFFPADSIGIVVLVNQQASFLPSIIRNTIADKFLQLSYRNWNQLQKNAQAKNKSAMAQMVNTDSVNRKANTKPSHPLGDYEGVYEHPAYGAMQIQLRNDTLWLDYHFTRGKVYLSHHHYDIFNIRSIDPEMENIDKARFNTGNKGDIESLEVQLDPAVKDIVFTKGNPVITVEKNDLEIYAGEYELSNITIKIYLRGNTLMMLVPGQPDYELVPVKRREFELKVIKGFGARFEVNEKNEAIALHLIQPNGTFKALRKK